MLITSFIAMLSMQLLTLAMPHEPIDPDAVQYEEFDLMLTDGIFSLGLVTGRLYSELFCVIGSEVKQRLGFNSDPNDDACISLQKLEDDHGIPLTLDMPNVELRVPADFRYPGKAYREALERMNNASNSTIEPFVKVASHRHSLWLDPKRIDLMLSSNGYANTMPDVYPTVGGDFLGGTFHMRAMMVNNPKRGYEFQPLDYNWSFKPIDSRKMVPMLEIGSRIFDSDHRQVLKGFRISNKPHSSRGVQFSERLTLQARNGSIVEWSHPMGASGQGVIDETGAYQFELPLMYGLNRIRYSLTEPGELTKHLEQWVRIPTKLIPSRRFEYQFMMGKRNYSSDSRMTYTKVEYGFANRLRVGLDHTSSQWDKRLHNQFGADFVLRPTFESDIQGYVNTDSEYAIQLTYWNPRFATIEASDNRRTTNPISQNRSYRRSTFVRANIHGLNPFRAQTSLLRTSYGQSTTSTLAGTVITSSNRWNIASNLGYQWWTNSGKLNTGLIRMSGHLSHRTGQNMFLASDIYTMVRNKVHLESVKLTSYFNASKYQLGATLALHAPENALSFGFSARVRSDWFNAQSQHEIHSHGLYSSHMVSTAWMKSGRAEWHAIAQTSQRSSGVVLIPFLDTNGNSIMDNGEQELSGLIGSIQEGRLIQNATNGNKLMFAELQPHRSYQITLSSDLRNDPEYLVSTTRLTVDTPGSGYRVINVPVAKSFEITGLWTTDDGIQVQPGRTRLIFTKIDGNSDIRGTLFGDGSWIVDKISPGTYTIFVSDNSNSNLAVYPNTIQVMANQDVSSKVIVIRNKA